MNTKLFQEKIYPIFPEHEKQIRKMAEERHELSMLIIQKYHKVCTCNHCTDSDILNLEHMLKEWEKEDGTNH
jgi:hypothetical protein